MAKVNIVIEDTDDDGGVSFHVEFDPPVDTDVSVLSAAQSEGAFIVELMQRRASGETLTQIAEEMDDYGTVGGFDNAEVEWADDNEDEDKCS